MKEFITRVLLRFLNNFQNSLKMCRASFNCCFCLLLEGNNFKNFEKFNIKEKNYKQRFLESKLFV